MLYPGYGGFSGFTTTSNGFTDTSSGNGTHLYYVTASYGSWGALESTTSNIVEVTVGTTGGSFPPPQNLVAVVSGYEVNLAWESPNTDGQDFRGYNVYRNGVRLGLGGYATTSNPGWVDTQVSTGTVNLYNITALYWDNNFNYVESATSNVVEVTVGATDGSFPPPQNLVAVVGNNNVVNLAWEAPNPGGGTVFGYHVFRNGERLTSSWQPITTNGFSDDWATVGGNHLYYVTAVYEHNSGQQSGPSNIVEIDLTVPLIESFPPPRNLIAVAGNDVVNLAWESPVPSTNHQIGYRLFRNGSVISSNISNNGFSDTGASTGQVHLYYVIAEYRSSNWPNSWLGESVTSNIVEVDLTQPPITLTFELVAVAGDGVVNLAWSSPAECCSGYSFDFSVYRNGTFRTSTSSNGWSDTSVSNGQVHLYYIEASCNNWWGACSTNILSNIVEVVLSHVDPNPAPRNLVAVPGNNLVSLAWLAPETSQTVWGYRVFRNGVEISPWGHSTNGFTDSNVTNGQAYLYYVTAVYASSWGPESAPSNIVEVILPTVDFFPPTNLNAMIGVGMVHLTWDAPENSVNSNPTYNVYRNNTSIAQGITTLSFSETPPISNTVYTYHITAVYTNPDGESIQSNAVIVTPDGVFNSPRNLEANVVNGTVMLTWQIPNTTNTRSLGYYRLYRNGTQIGGNIDTTVFVDDNISNGVTYLYYVTAVYSNNQESAPSNTALVTSNCD
jgi:fibronectin type 3 domain-containing protein